MYVINLSNGSVILPSGHELVTWLEVLDSEVPSLKRYEGTLLKLSKTKPVDGERESVPLPVEDGFAQQGGNDSLAEAMKTVKERNEAVKEPEAEQEVIDDKVPAKKSKKAA